MVQTASITPSGSGQTALHLPKRVELPGRSRGLTKLDGHDGHTEHLARATLNRVQHDRCAGNTYSSKPPPDLEDPKPTTLAERMDRLA